ncbi:MAG: STAS domain-containing protein [Lachnospiraceae bacterium]|nr:STAS domain-containing protein [Lachnospiraceae bacterium]
MTIETERTEEMLLLRLEGRLDTNTAPQLQEVLDNMLEDIKELQIDMERLEYVTSAGLRILLATMKKMKAGGGSMTVRHVNSAVMEVFNITGFKRYLDIR